MQNQIRGLVASLLILALTACGSGVANIDTVNINFNGDTTPEDSLISRCIVGNTAQSDLTCAEAVAGTNGCIINPFSSGCETNPLFSPHVHNARNERVKFCNDLDNAGDNFCTGSDSVKDICDYHPFSRVCDDSHETTRANRVIFCNDGRNSENNRCTIIHPCYINPFGTDCSTDTTYVSFRNQRINFCGMMVNKNDAICAVALSRPNTASFLQGFEPNLRITAAGVTRARAHFLLGTADGIDSGDGTSTRARYTLNLATGDGQRTLGGDRADGIALYRGTLYSHAGIFSGTDLGAPVTKKSGVATWNGRFIVWSDTYRGVAFTLTVNFGAGEQAGTIAASAQGYSLTGSFDNIGVIRGDVSNHTRSGSLRGLIGQEGAVGVFISNAGGSRGSYAGGFVARPPDE